jgi:Uma2 family endonuclease
MAEKISKRLFTVDDYHRMVDAGILKEKDRVELIRGEVVEMSPIGPPHNGSVIRALNTLVPLVGKRALVSSQGAVRLDQYDEPQPDIVLLRPSPDFYTSRHPAPQDIFLIIEIADSSLEYDQTVKADVYAITGVIEYWVADIPNDCVWAYSGIQNDAYSVKQQFRRGVSIEPRLLPGCQIPADTLLP